MEKPTVEWLLEKNEELRVSRRTYIVELSEAKNLVILLVHAAGGEIRIPHDLLAQCDLKIERHDDAAQRTLVFKAKEE